MIDLTTIEKKIQSFIDNPNDRIESSLLVDDIKSAKEDLIKLKATITDSIILGFIDTLISDIDKSLETISIVPDPKRYDWVDIIDIQYLEKLYGKDGIDGILKKIISKLKDINNPLTKLLIDELSKLFLSIKGGTLLGPVNIFPYSSDANNDPKHNQQLAASVGYVDNAIKNFDISKLNGFDMGGFGSGLGNGEGSGEYLEKVSDISLVDNKGYQIAFKNILLPDYRLNSDNSNLAASRAYVDSKFSTPSSPSGNFVESSVLPITKLSKNTVQNVKNHLRLPTSDEMLESDYAISKGYVDGLFKPSYIMEKIGSSNEFKNAVLKLIPTSTNTTTTASIDYSKLDYKQIVAGIMNDPTLLYAIIKQYHIDGKKNHSSGAITESLNGTTLY